jgi:hypothetical protein
MLTLLVFGLHGEFVREILRADSVHRKRRKTGRRGRFDGDQGRGCEAYWTHKNLHCEPAHQRG